MLRVDGLSASYGPVRALEQVSLEVNAGAIVCLLGANGAGKTTTLNCISGIVAAAQGRISFAGEEITRASPEAIVSRGLVQVPEGREIFPHLSVRDNLLMGAWTRRRARDRLAPLEQVFDYFPRLQERERQLAGTLSGGEQQMLMLGRALMSRPKMIMLDEPSLGLSPLLVQQLFAIITRMHQAGMTFLLVEQNARVALAASSSGYILENGRIFLQGSSGDLRENPAVIDAYLGG